MQTGGLARFGSVFFHGWKTSLVAIALGMALSLLLVGFSMPYWKIADQDLPLAYNGLLLNDGRAQEYFEHTGYLYHLLLAAWYRLLHWLGFLPVHALSELPPAADVAGVDRAWQQLVEAGRVLSLILGVAFVWAYAALMRRLIGDWRIAVMAAIALAWSGGVAMHIRIMRTELLSAGLVTCALLLVVVAARARAVRRAVYIGLAGLCASLAIITKVQALLPALAIPIIALAFGQTVPAGEREAPGAARPWTVAAVAIAVAVALALPAFVLLAQGMAGGTNYRPIGGGMSGIYQWLIALWVAVTSPGPIFYRQPRIGFKGRRFMLIKFRTMKVNAETHIHEAYLEHLIVSDRPMIKLDSTGDPRLILGGKFLRATGLDELPQIFNVLKGEMSLVGPRPCTVGEFERYAPEQRARVNALPGLTGLWQVNGKNRTTFRQMIEMDIFYSRNISLSLDLKIILRTLPAIVGQFSDSVQPSSRSSAQPTPPVKT